MMPLRKRFKKIYLEITNCCNLACSFCPQDRRQKEFISKDFFTVILDQIKPFTDYLNLHVQGEPLLHPEIAEIIALAGKKGFQVNLTTNGILIEKKGLELLFLQGLRQVNFSLHGLIDQFAREESEKYFMKILEFSQTVLAESSCIVSFRFWNAERQNTVQTAENQPFFDLIENFFCLRIPWDERTERTGGIRLRDRLYLNFESRFQWPDIASDPGDPVGFCYGLRDQAAVLVDGTVVPCCLDHEGIIRLGNLHNQAFGSIIESDRARNLYLGFSENRAEEELCRKCPYKSRFER